MILKPEGSGLLSQSQEEAYNIAQCGQNTETKWKKKDRTIKEGISICNTFFDIVNEAYMFLHSK